MYARLHPTRWISSETAVFCSNTICIKKITLFFFFFSAFTKHHIIIVILIRSTLGCSDSPRVTNFIRIDENFQL